MTMSNMDNEMTDDGMTPDGETPADESSAGQPEERITSIFSMSNAFMRFLQDWVNPNDIGVVLEGVNLTLATVAIHNGFDAEDFMGSAESAWSRSQAISEGTKGVAYDGHWEIVVKPKETGSVSDDGLDANEGATDD